MSINVLATLPWSLANVTADDVEKLLAQQPTDYLLLGQTLVNNGALTNAEFEKAHLKTIRLKIR